MIGIIRTRRIRNVHEQVMTLVQVLLGQADGEWKDGPAVKLDVTWKPPLVDNLALLVNSIVGCWRARDRTQESRNGKD
jgi:hypothetical protein